MSSLIPVAAPYTPEWYAARSTGIGASEMAAAVGLSDRRQPLQVFLQKTGQLDDFEENEAIEAGRFMEDGNRRWYCHRTKTELLDPAPWMHRHPDYPFIFATPDGIVTPKLLLECKNTGEFIKKEWGDIGTDDVPTEYLVQSNIQMSTMGADECDLSVVIGGNKLRIFRLLRNDDLLRLIFSAAEELWERIQRNDPPPPDFSHKTSPRLIRAMHQSINDVRVMLSDSACAARMEYEQLGKVIKDAEKRQGQCQAIYEHEIGDNFAGVLEDGRMIRRKWIEGGHRSFDVAGRYDYRAVKFDNGPITENYPVLPCEVAGE